MEKIFDSLKTHICFRRELKVRGAKITFDKLCYVILFIKSFLRRLRTSYIFDKGYLILSIEIFSPILCGCIPQIWRSCQYLIIYQHKQYKRSPGLSRLSH